MVRKCSHCGKNGHNSRTCISTRSMAAAGGVKLFGVQLHMASYSSASASSSASSSSSSSSSDFPLKKSFSMECLACSFLSSSSSPSSSTSSLGSIDEASEKLSNGYLSDGLGGRTQERKKGVPWTEEEHRSFLGGLAKLGKGDWRGISRNFVTSRTPTQVASHAQKYFLRQNSLSKRKRRSSLFDVVASSEGASHEASEAAAATAVDLSSSAAREQEIHLPPPSSSQAQLSHLDLELRISSPRPSPNPSSEGSLCLGTVNAF